MAGEVLFRGCYGPALELMVAFAGEEHGVALRYLSRSTRALLPLSRFPRLRTPERLRAVPCLEAIIQVATKYPSGGYVAALIITLVEGGGRKQLSGEIPSEAEQKPSEVEEEESEDRNAIRILRWALASYNHDSPHTAPTFGGSPSAGGAKDSGGSPSGAKDSASRHHSRTNSFASLGDPSNSFAPPALGPPSTPFLAFPPKNLLILNEANVYRMLRSPRYRRRILRFVRHGLLYSASPRFSELLSHALQRYLMTLDFVQHALMTRRKREHNVVEINAGNAASFAPRIEIDSYGLTPQQVHYVRHHLVYPPPSNLSEIAQVAVEFAEIDREIIPLGQ